MMDIQFISVVVVALVVLGIVFISYILPRRKSEYELDKTAIYEEHCRGIQKFGFGFRAGSSLPNWRIAFYNNEFVIASLSVMRVKYIDVGSVEYRNSFMSSGLLLEIKNPKINLILKPINPKKMLEIFKENNVQISRQDAYESKSTAIARLAFLFLILGTIAAIVFLTISNRA